MRRLARFASSLLVFVLFAGGAVPAPAAADPVLVFAAASLKNALDDAAASFEKGGGGEVKISYAASSALARQIESGAPADMFISADLDWMKYVADRNLIQTDTRANLLGNRLVLIAPASSKLALEVKPGFALADALGGGRLAMADPESVPAGKYGKAALQKLGVWSAVVAKIAPAEDVRAALRFVARGEAPLGIVYATDAAAEPDVRIVAAFPQDSYPPIIYPVALTSTSKNPAAAKFEAFLRSPAARPFFEKQGFTLLSRRETPALAQANAR
ncbi:MAG TPA: molybdate ABC transporter substrate-binding protein [Stellaceae bacterium]|nr:molybdate ABC transporter substrate-binding protein [Stellaceae bacterium]